jgi:prevent-host-death family protein
MVANVCSDAAPILFRSVGKTADELRVYFRRRGWRATIAGTTMDAAAAAEIRLATQLPRKRLRIRPNWPKHPQPIPGSRMKTLTAKDAKYCFGRLIDLARAEPVAVAKHGRPVVVVMAVEEFERLMARNDTVAAPARSAKATDDHAV